MNITVQSRKDVLLGLALFSLTTSIGSALAQTSYSAVHKLLPGIDNFYQISPQLYRSAQPTREGFRSLETSLGAMTIVNLRELHSDDDEADGTKHILKRIRMNAWNIGDDGGEKIVRAMKAIRAGEANGPVLIHCLHGSDRTGAMVALYRILYQGADKEAAIKEMMDGGFGFHAIFAVLPNWGSIPAYIRTVDIADLRRRIEAP